MGGRFTEIPQETFEQIVVDAGVLLRRFDLFDPDYDITPDIITATTGGVELSAEMEITDLGEDVDNCPEDTMELARLTSWNCRIGSTAVGSSPEIMQMILGAADLSGDIDVIPRAVLELSDFKDLWWVGDRVDGGLLAVHIANALSISGLSLQTSKAQKGQFDFEIQAHVSIYDLDRVPMTFYVMAPGSWVITGLNVPDFAVQKGVPTRIPVKYVMQDGSEMDPTDYGHDLTYTATLPAGATLTEDGILTLTGDDDTATITVTLTKGGGTMSDTAEVEVERPRVVSIFIDGGDLVVPEDVAIQVPVLFKMSDGTVVTPTDYTTGFTYTGENVPEGTTISASGVITPGDTGGTFPLTVTYVDPKTGGVFTAQANVQVDAPPPMYVVYSTRLYFPIPAEAVPCVVEFRTSSVNNGATVNWGDGATEELPARASGLMVHSHTYTSPAEEVCLEVLGDPDQSRYANFYFSDTGGTAITPYLYNNVYLIEHDAPGDISVAPLSAWRKTKTVVFGPNSKPGQGIMVNNKVCEKVYFFHENLTLRRDAFTRASVREIHFKKNFYIDSTQTTNHFQDMTALEFIDLSGSTQVTRLTSTAIIRNFPETAKIYVPAAMLTQWQTATNWSTIADRFVGV